jgi:hypothetical protein
MVWQDAVVAAGQPSLWTKRLRAYAASILYAAEATAVEAQFLLGHLAVRTTQAHYLVAKEALAADPGILMIRTTAGLSEQERKDALWDLWVERHGDPLSGAL